LKSKPVTNEAVKELTGRTKSASEGVKIWRQA
jgi:hypothetical protein